MIEIDKYQSAEIGELAAALAEAQGKIYFALKDSTAPSFGGGANKTRKYASLQAVLTAIKAPLSEAGLAFVQTTLPSEQGIIIRTVLMHKSGQWISGVFQLPPDRQGGVQGLGSALTYARRYALSAMVGICADDDDDGEATVNRQPARQTRTDTDAAEKKDILLWLNNTAFPTVCPNVPSKEYGNLLWDAVQKCGGKEIPTTKPARATEYTLSTLKLVRTMFEADIEEMDEAEHPTDDDSDGEE